MGIFRKQTVRAPWTTVLLVLLLALSIAASSIGFAAWTGANKQFEEINRQYTTIAIPSGLNQEKELKLEGYKILVTHGHHYYVSMNNEFLKQEASARGYDIVMYGHTHRPVIDRSEKIIAINPGSLTYPRQEGRLPSYLLMEIDDKKEVSFELFYLQ